MADSTAWKLPGAVAPPTGLLREPPAIPETVDAPDAFSIDHNQGAALYQFTGQRHGSLSRCVFDDPTKNEVLHSEPMGYASWHCWEKRAVVRNRKLLRIWPRSTRTGREVSRSNPNMGLQLIYPGSSGNERCETVAMEDLEDIEAAVDQAIEMSRTRDTPILVADLTAILSWH
ncbi:hypothetical protein [Arthrobacter sp. H5]|uniref:hypothetical protein n=1 Tax=Arthrobacter sp. H5 TaxID=1267973 RepID=UPI0012DF2C0A|nr:hypothetical protein [Arthrobacter sp. H5]